MLSPATWASTTPRPAAAMFSTMINASAPGRIRRIARSDSRVNPSTDCQTISMIPACTSTIGTVRPAANPVSSKTMVIASGPNKPDPGSRTERPAAAPTTTMTAINGKLTYQGSEAVSLACDPCALVSW